MLISKWGFGNETLKNFTNYLLKFGEFLLNHHRNIFLCNYPKSFAGQSRLVCVGEGELPRLP